MPRERRSDGSGAGEASADREGGDPRRLLDRSPSARLTVVTAPAGSGKSRLVREWLADPGPDGGSADWVRIDLGPEDRNPAPALQRTLDEAIGWLAAAGRVRPKFVLTGLEMLTASEVSHLVDTLLNGLPPGVRLVLIGAGSGLPASSQVRLCGDLVELRANDLWWSRVDLADQLTRHTGIAATPAEAEQLFRLTGGWPAGVIILGRAMLSSPDVLAARDLTTIPEILDFVQAEVLERLPTSVRRWVRRTSVLDELDADDCAALVPDEIPLAMLTQVHRDGLTVALWPAPEDLGRTSADRPRYHPLVRAAAGRELRWSDAGAARNLLLIAGEQARRRGREQAAVAHLAAAEAWDDLLATLLSSAANGFRGWDPTRLRAAVQNLPEHVWAHDAERRALIAFAAGMSGDQIFAAQVIRQTPAELRAGAGWWAVLAKLIEALSGAAGGVNGGYRAACAALVEAQALDRSIPVPPIVGVTDPASLAGMAHLLAARAGVFDRDQSGVRRQLEAGWSEAGAQVPRYCMLAGLGADAITAAWGGQLAAAARRAARAQRLADEAGLVGHPMLSLALLAQVEVLRARGDSTAALAVLDGGALALTRSEPFIAAASGGRVHAVAGQILRAMLHLDRADPAAARRELDRLDADGDDDLPRNLAAARAVAWARLHLLADEVTAAETVLAAAPVTGTVAALRVAAALHRQCPEEAQEILHRWPFEDTLANRIRQLLAGAAVAIAQDQRHAAGGQIDAALVAAEPDGHVQLFLDAPPRARALASAVLDRSLNSSGWRAELAGRLDRVRIDAPGADAVPVTRRERAVLVYLTTTLTHTQIAAQLFVSENTLKSHCRNLYRKLGVNTRADAIKVARARGLLEPESGSSTPGDVPVSLPAGAPGASSPGGDVVLSVNITPDPVVVEL